jgi:hypothetical protein
VKQPLGKQLVQQMIPLCAAGAAVAKLPPLDLWFL